MIFREPPMVRDHMTAEEAQERLRGVGSSDVAVVPPRIFKAGPGEYGKGDVFIGVRVR